MRRNFAENLFNMVSLTGNYSTLYDLNFVPSFKRLKLYFAAVGCLNFAKRIKRYIIQFNLYTFLCEYLFSVDLNGKMKKKMAHVTYRYILCHVKGVHVHHIHHAKR